MPAQRAGISLLLGRALAEIAVAHPITLLTAVTPWRRLGVGENPFVRVLAGLGIPAAAGVMNFVVLSAALSSANANLYVISRTCRTHGPLWTKHHRHCAVQLAIAVGIRRRRQRQVANQV